MENNIEFIIEGTKDGYREFYKKKPYMPTSIGIDVRRNSNPPGNPLGKTAYAFTFAHNVCAFTKYIIIWDQQRRAIGNVGFTLCFNPYRRLPGEKILALLNEMADIYLRKYIEPYSYKLDKVTENWDEFEKIRDKYVPYLQNFEDVVEIRQGNKEADYIYYSENELIEYFNSPFWEIFNNYQYILFIDKKLRESLDNPKYALRHNVLNGDLTGKINIFNKRYRLKAINEFKVLGYNISIKSDNKEIVDNDFIYKEDIINIKCSKNYFQDRYVSNKLLHDEAIKEFLEIDESLNIVKKSNKFIPLIPEQKRIKISLSRTAPVQIESLMILNRNIGLTKSIKIGDEVIFSGDELRYTWEIIAEGYGIIDRITPVEHGDSSVLKLKFPQLIKIIATDSKTGETINNLEVRINGNPITLVSCIELAGDESSNNLDIKITDNNYKFETLRFKLNPKDKSIYEGGNAVAFESNSIKLKLNKKTNPISNPIENSSLPKNRLLGISKLKLILIPITILSVIGIIFVSMRISSSNRNKAVEIKTYCQGTVINYDKLQEYNSAYCKKQNFLKIFGFAKPADVCSDIDNAIKIREYIREGEIDELIRETDFSKEQNLFIEELKFYQRDSLSKDKVKEILRSNSEADLDIIADSLQSLKFDINRNLNPPSKEEQESTPDEMNSSHSQLDSRLNSLPKNNTRDDEINRENQYKEQFWQFIKDKAAKKSFEDLNTKLEKYKAPSAEISEIRIFVKDKLLSNFKKFQQMPQIDVENAFQNRSLEKLEEAFK